MLQSASSCVWMLVTRRQVSTSVQRCTRNQWHNFPESIYVYICAYINVVLFHFSTANTLWLYHGRGNKLLISPFYSGWSEQRPVVMTFNQNTEPPQHKAALQQRARLEHITEQVEEKSWFPVVREQPKPPTHQMSASPTARCQTPTRLPCSCSSCSWSTLGGTSAGVHVAAQFTHDGKSDFTKTWRWYFQLCQWDNFRHLKRSWRKCTTPLLLVFFCTTVSCWKGCC